MTQPATSPSAEQAVDDRAAIERAALDYAQGWYEGDAGRIGRALHPELAKRAIQRDPQTGAPRFSHLTRDHMIAKTQQGGGTDVPAERRSYAVTILDVYGSIASARVDSAEYVDYLHLARVESGWQIVNVLWAAHPDL